MIKEISSLAVNGVCLLPGIKNSKITLFIICFFYLLLVLNIHTVVIRNHSKKANLNC